MKFTPREIFSVFLVFVIGLLSLFSWQTFFAAVLNPDSANISSSLLWFSLLGTFFLLGAVVWRSKVLQAIGTILLFLPGFLFIHTWWHVALGIVSAGIAFLGLRSIQNETKERLHFHFFRNIRAGSFSLILSFSLALSSGYFSSIAGASWEDLVPRFRVGEGTAVAVFKTVAYFYPEYRNLSEEGMTVDGFLTSLEKNVDTTTVPNVNVQEAATSLPELAAFLRANASLQDGMTQDELTRELYLRSGRSQIAALVGRDVSGDEKIADVFSVAVQNKLITALSGGESSKHISPQIIPIILSVLLFITLLSLGSIIGIFWGILGFILFHLILSLGWVSLVRLPQEQETLAE